MAKSEVRMIHVWWTVETLVFQHTGGRENDFASSITFGDSGSLKQNCHERGELANSKLLVNQWRNEPSSRDPLGHQLAFTKSAQEPTIIDSDQALRPTLIAPEPTVLILGLQ